MVEVCAVAKRDLKAGEILDDYGMYMTYGEAVNVDEMSKRQYLPEGLVEGCKLKRDIKKDAVLTYSDVELPPNRLADRLRAEQYRHFRGETLARGDDQRSCVSRHRLRSPSVHCLKSGNPEPGFPLAFLDAGSQLAHRRLARTR